MKNRKRGSTVENGRRTMLKTAGVLLGSMAAGTGLPVSASTSVAASSRRGSSERSSSVVADDGAPTVQTESGTVVGYVRHGINTFKGIPYAASTEGANRFMPPLKAAAWQGVRSARQYGYVAPQNARAGWANDEQAFMFEWDDGIPSEDCLRVNLWTAGIRDGKPRPVMVWLHGGGFTEGSGQELRSYDGENLARRGDVVVVTLNHRLNLLGHLDLSAYGERYATSANVGMLDIVAALIWVRDNITAFGGDPYRITIFGQSGGGGKVSALMGMPSAKGLFHRAIVESGSMMGFAAPETSRRFADLIVAELGLTPATIDRIQSLPYAQLLQASDKVLREHRPPRPASGLLDFRSMAKNLGFAPVIDGRVLPAQPFQPQASELSADVPMIIGTTLNEFGTGINHPEFSGMTPDDLETRVKTAYGDRSAQVLAAFRGRAPNAAPFDLWSRIASAPIRQAAILQATAKAALGKAPVYLYWFTWQTPILSRRPGAFHCSEIAFVFDNTDRCENMTGGSDEARALAALMSATWIRFAHTGDPNHSQLPRWDAYTPQTKPTMFFDNRPLLVDDPDAAEQRSIADG